LKDIKMIPFLEKDQASGEENRGSSQRKEEACYSKDSCPESREHGKREKERKGRLFERKRGRTTEKKKHPPPGKGCP